MNKLVVFKIIDILTQILPISVLLLTDYFHTDDFTLYIDVLVVCLLLSGIGNLFVLRKPFRSNGRKYFQLSALGLIVLYALLALTNIAARFLDWEVTLNIIIVVFFYGIPTLSVFYLGISVHELWLLKKGIQNNDKHIR